MRTPQEYSDFMSNVRASMVVLYRAIQSIGVDQLSSKQAAEINTSMDEVAIFLQLKKPASMTPAQQQKVEKDEQCNLPANSKKPGLLTKLRKMVSRKR